MNRKYIDQLLSTGLKYFFDLDYTTFVHSFTVIIIAAGVLKLAAMWLTNEVKGGIDTVKKDATVVKTQLVQLTAVMYRKEQILYNYVKDIKSNISNDHERFAA